MMLEKSLGNIDVQNLRVILLIGSYFIDVYKIIFNGILMLTLEEENEISIEIIRGSRTQAATYLALNKKLISDIANVKKLLTATTCEDATNYLRVCVQITLR